MAMRVAGFNDKPNAKAAANVLREHGYDVETIGVDGDPYPSSVADLPEPVASALWAKAFVLSNCDGEYFREIVVDNYGMVVWQHRPGRFHRLESESQRRR